MAEKTKSAPSMMTTAYHVTLGPSQMYTVDAESAAARFPNEWSLKPWPTGKKGTAAANTEAAADDAGGDDTSGAGTADGAASSSGGPVEIPADWASLSFPKRRAIAVKLGAANNVKGEEADALIATEVERRAAAPKPA